MNLLNTLTRSYVLNSSYNDVSQSIGAALVFLAIAAVVMRIALEAWQRHDQRGLLCRFDVLAAPLVIALGIIVLNRLLDLFPR